jgi:hypothetical protein
MATFDVHAFLTQCFIESAFEMEDNVSVNPFEGSGASDVLELVDEYLVQVLQLPPQPNETRSSISETVKRKGASAVLTLSAVEADSHWQAIERAEASLRMYRDVLALAKYQRGLLSGFLSIRVDVHPPHFYTFIRPPYPVLQKTYNLIPTEERVCRSLLEKSQRHPLLAVYLALYADAVSFSDNVITDTELQTRLLKLWTLLETMALEEEPHYKREKVEALFHRYPAFIHPGYTDYVEGDVIQIAYEWRNIIVHSGGCGSVKKDRDRKFCVEHQSDFARIVQLLTWACRDLLVLHADSLP